MSFWQRIKHLIIRFFGFLKLSKSTIGPDMRAQFRTLIEPQFRQDITDWVTRDMNEFSSLVQGEVKGLLDDIDAKIEAGIEKASAKQGEREATDTRLKHFSEQCDNAFLRVAQLRTQVEKVRPT